MRSYAAEVFWAVLPRKSFLKLKARSRSPVNADLTSPVQRWRYCCRMKMCPFYSTMAISTQLSFVLIYLFTYICSVRVVLLFILGHHEIMTINVNVIVNDTNILVFII